MTIYSHPQKPLITHLREVGIFCHRETALRRLQMPVDQKVLEGLAYVVGALHDLGKATRNFQEYLLSGGQVVTRPKHHALISAFVAKEVATRFLADFDLEEFDRKILPYFVFVAVRRHHGNLSDMEDELLKIGEKRADLLLQADNFYEQEVQQLLDELLAFIEVDYQWSDFKVYIKSCTFEREFADFYLGEFEVEFSEKRQADQVGYFYLFQYFYSLLLFADKSDVILDRLQGKGVFDYAAIRNFREAKGFNKPRTAMDALKNKAYFEGLAQLEKSFDPAQSIYSITLPTGMGKTITSLALGMALRAKLSGHSRIIVTIPFTSIIDQNFEVFAEIFKQPGADLLLKHHHLSEPLYKATADTVKSARSADESQFLIETWQSEVVVTTFVQLLEAMFTNNKGKLLKLPNLMNAVIIIDEIQQIKYAWWELVREAFKVIGERYGCYFILMSATMPLIFHPEEEAQELIPNHLQYFRAFNRTRLVNRLQSSVTLADFSKTVADYFYENKQKDILVILNTKRVTRACFEALVAVIPAADANLYFLSTSITPFERKEIIHRIKNRPNKRPNIIISTQLIEAGVDISVNTVFRALAPLDSIVQAAGRANRYSENSNPSDVFLYEIKELKQASAMIYGAELIEKTRRLFAGRLLVEERDYPELIAVYFKAVRLESDHSHSPELNDLCALNFRKVGQFRFIEERDTESVYIQLDETAKELWSKYVQIYGNDLLKKYEKRAAFAKIKSKFYDYVINVPIPKNAEKIPFDREKEFHFYLSTLEEPSTFYSYQKGNFRQNMGYV